MTRDDWDNLGPLGRLGITGMTRNDLEQLGMTRDD